MQSEGQSKAMNKQTISHRLRAVMIACGILVLLQAIRFGLKQMFYYAFPQVADERFVSMCVMILMSVGIVLTAHRLGMRASVFPKERIGIYAAAGVLAVSLMVSGPLLMGASDWILWQDMIYGSVVTPIFEELIFRGYLWESLKKRFDNEFHVYLITTVLFALWHFGYVDSLAARIGFDGLGYVMLMKASVGLVYGVIVGFVRYKTKNAYASILLHGVMNVFGR